MKHKGHGAFTGNISAEAANITGAVTSNSTEVTSVGVGGVWRISDNASVLEVMDEATSGNTPFKVLTGDSTHTAVFNRSTNGGSIIKLNCSAIAGEASIGFQSTGTDVASIGYVGSSSNFFLKGSSFTSILLNLAAPTNSIVMDAQGDIGFGRAPQPAVHVGMYSTNQGFLKPRMSTIAWKAISNPPAGLEIYDESFYIPMVKHVNTWQPMTTSPQWLDLEDDFCSGLLTTGAIGSHGWAFGTTAPTTVEAIAHHPGTLQVTANNNITSLSLDHTTATGTAEQFHSDNFSYCCFIIRTDASSIANTEITAGLIQGDLTSAYSSNLGVHFRYDAASNANWTMITRNVSATTTTSTIPVATNTWYRLEITYDTTNIRYYINGVLRASHANTNYPSTALKFGVQHRSTTAADRSILYDYAKITMGPLSR